ncbi:MAG: HypC/HybG/HupF family hydrogenase formation chaperone [Symbiobacterium sp.]|uniref:HypC/HybG/HupF family hydrogenase formation chaperone n=1 Tax=Symbiobacterium sp. TaxID=1971213 RepID=UPI003463EA0A
MCLAVPAQVVELHDDRMATVSLAGVTRRVSLDLVDDVRVGDWVAVHVGFALHRIDEEEARATLALFESIAEALAELGVGQGEDGAAAEAAAVAAAGNGVGPGPGAMAEVAERPQADPETQPAQEGNRDAVPR